jgi:hypothetical protein
MAHLLDVCGGMELVGIAKRPGQVFGEKLSHRRFAGPGDSHDDEDHGTTAP